MVWNPYRYNGKFTSKDNFIKQYDQGNISKELFVLVQRFKNVPSDRPDEKLVLKDQIEQYYKHHEMEEEECTSDSSYQPSVADIFSESKTYGTANKRKKRKSRKHKIPTKKPRLGEV